MIALAAMHEQEADVLRGGGAGRVQRRRGLPVGAVAAAAAAGGAAAQLAGPCMAYTRGPLRNRKLVHFITENRCCKKARACVEAANPPCTLACEVDAVL